MTRPVPRRGAQPGLGRRLGLERPTDSFNLFQPVEVREYTIYGTLFARQMVPSGLYSDSIVRTVSF